MKNSNPMPKLYQWQVREGRRVGRYKVCLCPVCGTRHLYVRPDTGLFKCFYAGCPYKGMVEEQKDALRTQGRKSHSSPVAAGSLFHKDGVRERRPYFEMPSDEDTCTATFIDEP